MVVCDLLGLVVSSMVVVVCSSWLRGVVVLVVTILWSWELVVTILWSWEFCGGIGIVPSSVVVLLMLAGWSGVDGDTLGGDGVGDRPLVVGGGGSVSVSSPQSWSRTGYFSFAFLFFLVDVV